MNKRIIEVEVDVDENVIGITNRTPSLHSMISQYVAEMLTQRATATYMKQATYDDHIVGRLSRLAIMIYDGQSDWLRSFTRLIEVMVHEFVSQQ